MSKDSLKSVLISGASSGIGRACVDLFLNHGWQIIAIDQRKPDIDFDDRVNFLTADLSKQKDIEALKSPIAEKADSGLHALVNNAAIQQIGSLLETEAEDWDKVMAVNLKAPFLMAKNLYELFADDGAAIVNVASVHALATSAGIGAYAASKGGLLALTRSMAIEFASRGVRVNAVLPGAIDTEMLKAGLQRESADADDARKKLEEKVLLGRIGRPEEIARAIYFLADEAQSSYITGQALVVDGGATSQLSSE
jgi:NAD(P)-dependent dehydrogenase (short-subunit alcohol dehydrogenase family)